VGTVCTVTEDANPLFSTIVSGSPATIDVDGETVTITNTRLTGRLVVVKELVPPTDPGLFNLLIDGEVVAANVGDVGTGFRTVDTGPHTVAETAGTGTDLADYTTVLVCLNAQGGVVPSPGGVVDVGEEEMVCTFTNVPLPQAEIGRIIIRKVADEYDTNQAFPFSSNFDGLLGDGVDFTLEAGQELAFDLEAGTFSVTELVPDGWNLVSAVCSDQSPVNAIVLAADETIICTFTNEQAASDYNDYPGDDGFDFDTPFDDAGDPGTPAPSGDTAGTNDQVGTQQPAASAPAPAPVVENNTTSQPQPDPAAPIALDQLPRTGQGLDRVTMIGGMLLILGGLSVTFGRRRQSRRS
ncbi:MAG: LPXTG cell wall anchor domain-containing protein, partial [Acidimicrobiia bacterium]